MPEPLAYRPRDAAAALGCGLTRLYELIAEGKLDARKLGSKTLITAVSLRAYVEGLPPAELTTGLRTKRAASAAHRPAPARPAAADTALFATE